MVRSQRYKYCVYDHGEHRESLVDLESDPGEMVNLAADPKHRKILLQHRQMLAEWCAKFDTEWPQENEYAENNHQPRGTVNSG